MTPGPFLKDLSCHGGWFGLIGTFRVGLLITERCNIECAHCWLGSGPDRGATMSMEDARGCISQAGEIPTVEWISLTGGEPFLYPELLEPLSDAPRRRACGRSA